MAYEIRALVCEPPLAATTAELLGAQAQPLTEGLHIVPLPRDGTIVPRAESSDGDPMLLLTADVEAVATEVSRRGRIAYIEAEFFGGLGVQASVVWDGGAVVHGPLLREYPGENPSQPGVDPINTALEALGVAPTGADAFDTVGLGRHRTTEEWREHASGAGSSPAPGARP